MMLKSLKVCDCSLRVAFIGGGGTDGQRGNARDKVRCRLGTDLMGF